MSSRAAIANLQRASFDLWHIRCLMSEYNAAASKRWPGSRKKRLLYHDFSLVLMYPLNNYMSRFLQIIMKDMRIPVGDSYSSQIIVLQSERSIQPSCHPLNYDPLIEPGMSLEA